MKIQRGHYGDVYYRLFGWINTYCWIADSRKSTIMDKKNISINCLCVLGWRII